MLSFVACAERGIDIVNLRCDYMESPLGVDNPNPVLQWQLISEGTGKSQSAYRIIVSDDLSLIKEDKEIIGTLESVVFRIYRPVSRQEVICQNATLLESDGLG